MTTLLAYAPMQPIRVPLTRLHVLLLLGEGEGLVLSECCDVCFPEFAPDARPLLPQDLG